MKTKVISQTSKIYEGDALSISMPTTEGVITVLPNHMDLVTLLDVGNINIQEKESEVKILISGGLVHIKKNNVTILSDEAVMPESVTLQEIEEAISNAKNHLAAPVDSTELVQLEKQLRFELFKKKFKESN